MVALEATTAKLPQNTKRACNIWRRLFCLAVRLGSSMAPCKLFGLSLSRPPQARDSRSLIWSAAVAASAGQDLMLSQYYTSVLSQQQSSVPSQQQTSVLSQQKTSILSQQNTQQQPAGGRQLFHLLLRQDRCLLLRQDRCLLLRQDRCLLLRQDRCLLLI